MIAMAGCRREILRSLGARRVGGEQHDVGRKPLFHQHLTGYLDGKGERQDRGRVRLDDDRIAGGKAGEKAGIAVPGGNVLQPMTSEIPRGKMRQCFSMTIGSPLPCGFVQIACKGVRVISA